MIAEPAHRTETLPSGRVVHVWTPETEPSALVQLQHGFAEYSERYVADYRQFVPELTARGIEVWAVDLEGHGRSPGRRAATDTRAAVDEHVALRRRLRGRGLPIVLIGHSYGGLITAASAARDAADVRGVILSAPVILSRTARPLRLLARTIAAIAPGANLPGGPAALAHDPEVARRVAADPLIYPRTTTLRVGATALDVADRLWAGIDGWRTPLTIFHGTRDAATAYERSAAFVAAIDRPDVRLRTVEGGFHELVHDHADDRAILDEMLGLVQQHLR